VIKKVKAILNRFWGRMRWPRTKLREVTAKNHGKELGLYRAKDTRFAGVQREMAQMLRLRADLQEVVIGREYRSKKFPSTKKEAEAAAAAAAGEGVGGDEDDDADAYNFNSHASSDPIYDFVMDEDGFWKPLIQILKVCLLSG
jgi:hypothetical protein